MVENTKIVSDQANIVVIKKFLFFSKTFTVMSEATRFGCVTWEM